MTHGFGGEEGLEHLTPNLFWNALAGVADHDDKEIRSKVFEPFFTTKPVGHGTGLGLAISYGIVKAHQGSIEFSSEPGKGTEFMLRIPMELRAEV